eukprot:351729-Chlamydomonas_euryale.AAC.11
MGPEFEITSWCGVMDQNLASCSLDVRCLCPGGPERMGFVSMNCQFILSASSSATSNLRA